MQVHSILHKSSTIFCVTGYDNSLHLRGKLTPADWDSEILGLSCAKIEIYRHTDRYNKEYSDYLVCLMDKLLEYTDTQGYDFLSIRTDHDVRLFQCLARYNFSFIESQLTFNRSLSKRDLPPTLSSVETRLAREGDLEACQEIADAALTQSRYHLDPNIGCQLGKRIKREWVKSNLSGRARCYVACIDHKVVGFIHLRETPDEDASVIDLIAVDPSFQRQGVGKSLVNQAFVHYWNVMAGHVNLHVSTQAQNVNAVRFYERLGFNLIRLSETFHRWKPPG